jgi:hypothetical protein
MLLTFQFLQQLGFHIGAACHIQNFKQGCERAMMLEGVFACGKKVTFSKRSSSRSMVRMRSFKGCS